MEDSRIYEMIDIARLISQSRSSVLTQDENDRLHSWIHESPENEALFFQLQDEEAVNQLLKRMAAYEAGESSMRILKRIEANGRGKLRRISWVKYAVAASVILIAGLGIFLGTRDGKENQPVTASATHSDYKNDVQPGRAGAILHMPDGSSVNLDTLQVELLYTRSGVISKDDHFASIQPGSNTSAISFVVLETPRSHAQAFKLPDGSIAWLNASSTLRFPTRFSGGVREVEITGEVYFEVAHDPANPFRVKTKKETVEVLGTHFNINANPYSRSQKTTLLEGSVKVAGIVLKPGQQYSAGEIHSADTSLVVAWKNGFFQFGHDTELPEIMAQLESWYGIEVKYESNAPQRVFYGKIPRSYSLVQALKILEEFNVHFRLEGTQLTVLR